MLLMSVMWFGACGPDIDRGQCLQPRTVQHHTDAMTTVQCLPTLGFDGEIGIDCSPSYEPARDWTVTVCDLWEFPNGKAEKDL